jgi:two-component system chemotaxis response regulator CheY
MPPMIYLNSSLGKQHGDSSAGSGCEECAELPARRKPRRALSREGASMAMTVLVVDDSATMVMSLKTTLAMSGFQVETASNGKTALEKLQSGIKPNLILTDINMPVMGGMELIKNVRALPGLRFVPILTLTTESDAAKRDEGKRAGATGWVVKPVSGNDLMAVIRKVLPGA